MQVDLVSKLWKSLLSKYFVDIKCNGKSTKKVNVKCAYKGECLKCCVFYKVTYKLCGDFNIGNTQHTLKIIMEKHFQYVAQKVMHDNNSDFFAANFAKNVIQNPNSQQCHKIISIPWIPRSTNTVPHRHRDINLG